MVAIFRNGFGGEGQRCYRKPPNLWLPHLERTRCRRRLQHNGSYVEFASVYDRSIYTQENTRVSALDGP